MTALLLAIIKIPMKNDYKQNYSVYISSYNPKKQENTQTELFIPV